MAIFEVKTLQPDRVKHFRLMVRDAQQIKEVRRKAHQEVQAEDGAALPVRFPRPLGNRIQVGDLSDESLVWLLPYQEVQKAGITFSKPLRARQGRT